MGKSTLTHEEAVKYGMKGGSPILKPNVLKAYRAGRLRVDGKVIKPPEKKKRK